MKEKENMDEGKKYVFNGLELRMVWDVDRRQWLFSAIDIVRAINGETDYTRARNYWKYLKTKLAKEGIVLDSLSNHFKFEAPDGKRHKADVMDARDVMLLAKHYPNNRAIDFYDWLVKRI